MSNKNSAKKIFAVISAVLSQCVCGSLFFYQAFSLYRHSQIKQKNPQYSYYFSMFILPLSFLLSNCFKCLGVFLSKRIGARITCSIGYFIILLSIFFIWISTHYVADYAIMSLYAIGVGITYMPPILNMYKYLDSESNSHSLLLGIANSGLLLSSLFALYFQFFLNWKQIEPTNSLEDEMIYDNTVINKIKLSVLFYLAEVAFFSILSIVLMFPPNESIENLLTKDDDPEKKEEEEDEKIDKSLPIAMIKQSLPNNDSMASKIRNQTFEALTSCTIYFYFFIAVLLSLYPLSCFITLTYYGKFRKIHDTQIAFASFGILLGWGVSSPIWGFIYKKWNLRPVIYVICAIQLVLGSAFYYSAEANWSFITLSTLSGMGLGFVHTVFPIYIQSLFGEDSGPYVYSYVSVAKGLCGFIIAGAFVLIKYKFQIEGYIIYIYITAAILNLLLAAIYFFKKDNKFEYEQ